MSGFSFEELRENAHSIGMDIGMDERDEMMRLAAWMTAEIDEFMVNAQPLIPPPEVVPSVRVVLGRPSQEADPLNAVLNWVHVEAVEDEVTSDVLAGKTFGVKDLISVAGVPISAASRMVEGFVPTEDAPVIQRILRAGGRIVAMTNMEGMAYGGGGESGDFGATRNPFDVTRSTSGSSGGSAAALFYDGVDITLGTDQGGSVRLPAAWCGVLGLKPTHGLVPYSGILSHDPTFDHVGPLARNVHDMAAVMSVISGGYWGDQRQAGGVPELPFIDAVETAPLDLSGIRVGVLEEALHDDGTPERRAVICVFEEFCETVEHLGGSVERVSIPEHALAGPMLFAAMLEGVNATVFGHGVGYHWAGKYSIETRRAIGKGLAVFGAELQPSYRMAAILGETYRKRRFGEVYSTAQTVIPALRRAYDRALEDVDVIAFPTIPTTAMELRPDASVSERQFRSFDPCIDTPAQNATGHPALSMPVGEVDGLPVGIQITGRAFADHELLRFAATWERTIGWKPLEAPGFGVRPRTLNE